MNTVIWIIPFIVGLLAWKISRMTRKIDDFTKKIDKLPCDECMRKTDIIKSEHSKIDIRLSNIERTIDSLNKYINNKKQSI